MSSSVSFGNFEVEFHFKFMGVFRSAYTAWLIVGLWQSLSPVPICESQLWNQICFIAMFYHDGKVSDL